MYLYYQWIVKTWPKMGVVGHTFTLRLRRQRQTISDNPGVMYTLPGGGWREAKENFLEDCSQMC